MPTIATNKKGLYEYTVIEEFEAGVVLSGPEVKSVKSGRVNLQGSYISIDGNNQAWLVGATIAPYRPASSVQRDYEQDRRRKLLLNKKELLRLAGKNKEKGLTIMPISVYTKGGLIKVSLGIVRGKRQQDKRDIIKKRQSDRDIRRALKR